MTERRTGNTAQREFSEPSSGEMRGIFEKRVGLVGTEAAKLKRISIIQSGLVARGLLFAMTPPIEVRSADKAHPHPVYAKAAFRGLPLLPSFTNERWLEEVEPHLKAFALKAASRKLIGRAVAAHYGRIAENTLKLPKTNDELWIPAHTTADGTKPLALMGVTSRRVVQSPHPHARHRTKDRRRFYRALGIIENTRLTIPGVVTEETQEAILDGFRAARDTVDPEKADPLTLFMATKVTVGGCDFGAGEIFGVQASDLLQAASRSVSLL